MIRTVSECTPTPEACVAAPAPSNVTRIPRHTPILLTRHLNGNRIERTVIGFYKGNSKHISSAYAKRVRGVAT